MSAQYTIQQGTVGVSRPKGKLLGVPFLTLVVPNISSLTKKLKQDSIDSLPTKEKYLYPSRSLKYSSNIYP